MPVLKSQIRREIRRIDQSGVSILLVEQNVETALRLCPRVVLHGKEAPSCMRRFEGPEIAARDRASLCLRPSLSASRATI